MKNYKTILMLVISTFLIFATTNLDAQNGKGKMKQNHGKNQMKADSVCDNNNHKNFLDVDGDGVCDNKNTSKTCSKSCVNFIDANNDGVCDNKGTQKNFVDANNDGICDNQNNSGKCNGNRNGKGKGKGNCQNNNQATIISLTAQPNPFSNSTTISFETKTEGNGSVILFDLNGNIIKSIYEGTLAIGSHSYTYSAENLTPGKYIFKIQINTLIKSIPVIYSN